MPETKTDSDILIAVIGGHPVTMTHRRAGTVLVSSGAYRHFRRIIVEREILDWHDNQSEVLAELGVSFDGAIWLKKPDRRGNMMLLDRDTGIMFIVESERRVLRCVFDHRLHKAEKKDSSKPAAPIKRAA